MLISLCLTSILNPGGRNVLKPTIRSGCPRNRFETRLITPGVSILGERRRREREMGRRETERERDVYIEKRD